MKRSVCVLIAAAVATGLMSWTLWVELPPPAQAQSGSRTFPSQDRFGPRAPARSAPVQDGSAPRAPVQTPQTFESRLWNWLQQAQYRNWAPGPGQGTDFVPGQGPHGEFVKVYANRIAAGESDTVPAGSIFVKESYSESRGRVLNVTVMYRVEGYDPQNGDWYWAQYEPDGRVTRMEGMPVSGRVGMCIECHRSAGGDDFVFVND